MTAYSESTQVTGDFKKNKRLKAKASQGENFFRGFELSTKKKKKK